MQRLLFRTFRLSPYLLSTSNRDLRLAWSKCKTRTIPQRRLRSALVMATEATLSEPKCTSDSNLPAPLLSVAPMMEWTDVFFRQVVRLMSRHSWLYTEMVVDKTLIHNPNHDKFLWFPPEQHPVVCQLGGSVPEDLAAAAAIVAPYGYDEINLNCGCPSPKVAGKGCFGATLMTEPQLVADCCAAMARVVDIPITVKCRLGVDDLDSYEELCNFVRTVSEGSPVCHFLIHCRKAILGLDPSDNRSVPPLRRGWAFALSRDFPHLKFSVNGQVATTGEALQTLGAKTGGGQAAGVMIGRAAWKKPWDVFGDADRAVFGAADNPAASRRQVLEQYAVFADGQLGRWGKRRDGKPLPGLRALVSPIAQLFFGEPGCGKWKRLVDAALKRKDMATLEQLLAETLHVIPDAVLDSPPRPVVITTAPLNLELPPPAAAYCTSGSPSPTEVFNTERAAAAASSAHASSAIFAETGNTPGADKSVFDESVPASSASISAALVAETAANTSVPAIEEPYVAAVSVAGEVSPMAHDPAATADVLEQPQLIDEQQAIPRGHQDSTGNDLTGLGGVDNDTAVRAAAIEMSEHRQRQRAAAAAAEQVSHDTQEDSRSNTQTISVAS